MVLILEVMSVPLVEVIVTEMDGLVVLLHSFRKTQKRSYLRNLYSFLTLYHFWPAGERIVQMH